MLRRRSVDGPVSIAALPPTPREKLPCRPHQPHEPPAALSTFVPDPPAFRRFEEYERSARRSQRSAQARTISLGAPLLWNCWCNQLRDQLRSERADVVLVLQQNAGG